MDILLETHAGSGLLHVDAIGGVLVGGCKEDFSVNS
jgi:hypothetical protein